jgi:hypothetical protein
LNHESNAATVSKQPVQQPRHLTSETTIQIPAQLQFIEQKAQLQNNTSLNNLAAAWNLTMQPQIAAAAVASNAAVAASFQQGSFGSNPFLSFMSFPSPSPWEYAAAVAASQSGTWNPSLPGASISDRCIIQPGPVHVFQQPTVNVVVKPQKSSQHKSSSANNFSKKEKKCGDELQITLNHHHHHHHTNSVLDDDGQLKRKAFHKSQSAPSISVRTNSPSCQVKIKTETSVSKIDIPLTKPTEPTIKFNETVRFDDTQTVEKSSDDSVEVIESKKPVVCVTSSSKDDKSESVVEILEPESVESKRTNEMKSKNVDLVIKDSSFCSANSNKPMCFSETSTVSLKINEEEVDSADEIENKTSDDTSNVSPVEDGNHPNSTAIKPNNLFTLNSNTVSEPKENSSKNIFCDYNMDNFMDAENSVSSFSLNLKSKISSGDFNQQRWKTEGEPIKKLVSVDVSSVFFWAGILNLT